MPALTDPQALQNIPLFRGLTEPQLESINNALRKRVFPAGTNVISVETPGEVVYMILSGTVKIKVDQPDGSEVIIALLGPGEIVGELSVLDSAGRSADVLTQEETTMVWVDRAGFQAIMDTVPKVMQNLLLVMSRRLRLATEQIQALCTLDVFGRVARQLIAFADLHGAKSADGVLIPMRLTQSDIAGLVGASRERVNQVFVNLRKRKYINVDGAYRITLTNVEKLRDELRRR